ncbi:MAG: hypothetical protein WA102_01705 [Candidatus Methanoperedens sp.]
MKKKINKLYADINKCLLRLKDSFIRNRDTINTISTVALVIVSILLIMVTIESYRISKEISNTQVYFALENEKQNTLVEITLAEDLLQEVKWNKEELLIIIRDYDGMKTNNIFRPDYIRTTKIQRATEMVGFGSKEMRAKFENYLTILNIVKDDSKAIQINYEPNSEIKIERIDHTLKFSSAIVYNKFENVNIDEFTKDIQGYIEERNTYYDELNKKLETMILT